MKLKNKITGGMLCIFMLAIFLGGYSLFAALRLNSMKAELDKITEVGYEVRGHVVAHHAWRYNIFFAFTYDTEFGGGLDPDTCVYGRWYHGSYARQIQDARVSELLRAIDQPHRDLHVQGGIALQLRAEGRTDEAQQLLQDVVLPAGAEAISYLAALSDRFEELRVAQSEAMSDIVTRTITFVIIFCITALIIFLILRHIITNSILKPIKRIVMFASDVADGNINVNINRTNLPDDEIGMLTQNVCSLVDVIKNIVDDLTKSYSEYIEVGNTSHTIDDTKYKNSFKEVVELVNNLLSQNAEDIMSLATALNLVNDGNFDVNLTEENWPGNWAILPHAINSFANNLKSVSTEIKEMVKAAAKKGNLSYNIDASKFSGDWYKIMNGLNNICKAVNAPIVEIRDALSVLNKGFFNTKINGDYAGDFLSIKNDFNFFIKDTAKYMAEINKCLDAIASGDLNHHISIDFIGEYAPTKQAVNHIADTLHQTMSEISAASTQVLMGAKQISTSAMDLANGAQEQAGAVDELNNTISIISQQTQKNVNDASEASNLSNKSSANAQEGNDAMKQMMIAMTKIKESSNDISKIIKVIQDISFQTNLLALNAAVEAARAGDHGKGFSVVAEEVRNLAAISQQSAEETTALIGDSVKRVETGSNMAESTAQTLDTIVKNATEVLEIVNNISIASKEQADAIEQIHYGLDQISSVVQNNSAVSEQTAASSQELNSQAELLQQLVAYFKL